MRIIALGDTHGKIDKALEILNSPENAETVDLVIHTGDLVPDAQELSAKIRQRLVMVSGNNDHDGSAPDYCTVETDAGDILVTHGHLDNVNFSQERLYLRAQEMGCIAAVYGHTHIPVVIDFEDGFHLINPGSLTRPFDGSKGSYAVIDADESGVRARIVYYENSGKSKIRGGHLRDLLNYSDRF